ncbi:MAG: DegV family protein, partial [Candidatus Heimdallarchaeota archaeon]
MLPIEIYKLWGRDNCEISTEDFHTKLEKISKNDLPTSSVPSPGLFVEAFENALSISDSVIAIFVGAKLSATVGSAQKIIQNHFPDKDITIFDSKQAMMGIGIQVLEAAKMAKEG